MPSQYAIALQAVGEIISDYDRDNLFPAFGFGAVIPPGNTVSHCFPLNGNAMNPYCLGIQSVMAAYSGALQAVKFHGPTNFAPVINTVASVAHQAQPGTKYFILLILTDGIISDMAATKDAIVNASSLPLSIIIVGVGNANFDDMDVLDCDVAKLTSRGQVAARDIVQFVPFRDFHDPNSIEQSKRRLSKAVLVEIPDQLVSYMRMHGITPSHGSRTEAGKINGFGPVPVNHAGFVTGQPYQVHPNDAPLPQ